MNTVYSDTNTNTVHLAPVLVEKKDYSLIVFNKTIKEKSTWTCRGVTRYEYVKETHHLVVWDEDEKILELFNTELLSVDLLSEIENREEEWKALSYILMIILLLQTAYLYYKV